MSDGLYPPAPEKAVSVPSGVMGTFRDTLIHVMLE